MLISDLVGYYLEPKNKTGVNLLSSEAQQALKKEEASVPSAPSFNLPARCALD